MVVGADRNCGSGWRGAMKKKNYSRNLMQLDQVCTFTSQLTCTQKVTPARGKRAPATGHIESVEAVKAESLVEKVVGLLLKSSVGAGDYKSVRPVRRPSAVGVGQIERGEFNASPGLALKLPESKSPAQEA